MPDIWLFLFFFTAVVVGWLIGRFGSIKSNINYPSNYQKSDSLSDEYLVGLDHLLNEEPDAAIESFIRALEINSNTIPAHLALAKLFRKKGDVERAIKIHQNLLTRPALSSLDSLKVQIALARDYDAIGLLDRTENLLVDIIRQHPPLEIRRKALKLLTKLYEKEKEWEKALKTAEKLTDYSLAFKKVLSHYCCEIAQSLFEKQQYQTALNALQQASDFYPDNVRTTLLKADILIAQNQYKAALKVLKQIEKQDVLFIPEALPRLESCYKRLNKARGYYLYLRHLLELAPSSSVIIALATYIQADQGELAARKFITHELKENPSIRGFNLLIQIYIEHGSDSARESLSTLYNLTSTLESNNPRYKCKQCGFPSSVLIWLCPSCKSWGSYQSVQGLIGE